MGAATSALCEVSEACSGDAAALSGCNVALLPEVWVFLLPLRLQVGSDEVKRLLQALESHARLRSSEVVRKQGQALKKHFRLDS